MPISHLLQMRGTLDNGIHILFLSFFPLGGYKLQGDVKGNQLVVNN